MRQTGSWLRPAPEGPRIRLMTRDEPEIRVLLVDDQPATGEAVLTLLSAPLSNGWSFHVESNPNETLRTAETFRPNVVLLGHPVAGTDGLQLLEQIRSNEDFTDVPIVILGPNADPNTKAAAFERGANDYLVELPEAVELQARLRLHASGFLAGRARDIADARNEKLSEQLRSRNSELQDLNRIFRLSIDALKDKVDLQGVQLKSIETVGIELSEIRDLDILMQHILTEARGLVRAEAGAILTLDGEELVVRYAQNDEHTSSGKSAAALAGGFRVPISLGSISGAAVATGEPINVDDVYAIPPDAGYRFLSSFDERTGYRTRALLAYPLRTATGESLGVLQLSNPLTEEGNQKPRFGSDDVAVIRNFASMASVALERARLTRSMILRMIAMAETHDPEETGAHVNRVAGYSRVLYDAWAEKRDLSRIEKDRQRDRLSISAMLHDVGKIGIPDAILKKPGKLDPSEYAAMQMHTVIGARLFKGVHTDFDDLARTVALHHHERWDGGGYPGDIEPDALVKSPPTDPIRSGLRGEEIPIEARIVGLADVYDALSSKRSYKEAWPEEQVLAEIEAMSGKHFDPELVELFLANSDRMRAIRETWRSE